MNAYVFDRGRIVPEKQVCISIRNKAFNYGLGVLDGIRAYWNKRHRQLYIFRLEEHLRRFLLNSEALFIRPPHSLQELVEGTLKLLRKNAFRQDVYIRPLAYKSSDKPRPVLHEPEDRVTIYCIVEDIRPPRTRLTAAVSSWSRTGNNMIPPWIKATGNYLNSALAGTEANLNGFDVALFLTRNGNVAEGSSENLFMVRGGALITPPVSDNILPGITRDTAILLAMQMGIPVIERSIPRAELYAADEVFVTGTYIEIRPVVRIDRRIVGTGEEGAVTRAIRRAYAQLVRGEHPLSARFCTPVY